MPKIAYPTDLPIDEIKSIIATIRSNSIVANRVEFAKSLWLLSGYATYISIGEVPNALGSPPPVDLTNEQAAELLTQAIAMGALPSFVENIPWTALLKWAAQLLITLAI